MISIHALREEGDSPKTARFAAEWIFLSTPSARRATTNQGHASVLAIISIHALREEGDNWRTNLCFRREISIHALREEGDGLWRGRHLLARHFYPRPPRGGRPDKVGGDVAEIMISIHALREEGD